MIDHVWTVICSRAVIDADSNILSLQSIIEQIEISLATRSRKYNFSLFLKYIIRNMTIVIILSFN